MRWRGGYEDTFWLCLGVFRILKPRGMENVVSFWWLMIFEWLHPWPAIGTCRRIHRLVLHLDQRRSGEKVRCYQEQNLWLMPQLC
jgi:hypothetical protein